MTSRADRPYVVLYRAARPTKNNPDRIVKGRRTFRTRREMDHFISTAPDNYAITYYS